MGYLELKDVLVEETIDISNVAFADKDALFGHLSDMLSAAGRISDRDALIAALYEREKEGSTYMGDGLAVPHCRSSSVLQATVAFCRCKPFEYVSDDDRGMVHLVAMLAIPEASDNASYLKLLSQVSRLLMRERFRDVLEHNDDVHAILAVCEEELKALLNNQN